MKRRVGFVAAAIGALTCGSAFAESFGSGFVINPDGYILTNNHVVVNRFKDRNNRTFERECGRLEIKGDVYNGPARIVGRDKINDLAVIKVGAARSTASAPRNQQRMAAVPNRRLEGGMRSLGEELADRSLTVSSVQEAARPAQRRSNARALPIAARSVTPGQQINLYGFPLGELVSSQMKVTRGIVVATMGPGNDSSLIQIDAAANSGNSGGPILDSSGNVVAVLSSGSDRYQGFNFGVNVAVAKQLMDSLGVAYATSPAKSPMSTEEQYKYARPYVVLITCY